MSKTEVNKIELYFEWWTNDMIDRGYIKRVDREVETLTVLPVSKYNQYKRFKRKPKEVVEFNLFPKIRYTYDYVIEWHESAEYLFYEEINKAKTFQFGKPLFIATRISSLENGEKKIVSYLDVKPPSKVQKYTGSITSSFTFPLKQRILWEEYGIYINKVIPIPMSGAGYSVALFLKSFTPYRYLMTDGGTRERKISYNPITVIEDFVKNRKAFIDNLLKNTK